ncbi:hypothetical protein KJI73_22975, partial [Salmonella enterica subsp. enterica]|uniref:hypothetical protein n=1 Tax=Salmonella enterica TaxID=28901 RepID=UPI00325A69B9
YFFFKQIFVQQTWMRECVKYHFFILELSDLQLTTLLDPLPEYITFLAVINNRLTKLPDTLPGGYRQITRVGSLHREKIAS